MRKLAGLFCLIFGLGGLFFLGGAGVAAPAFAGADDLFTDEMIVESQELLSTGVDQELTEERVSFTGEITAVSLYSWNNPAGSWFSPAGDGVKKQAIQSSIAADLFLDIRFKKGDKAFLNLEIKKTAAETTETAKPPEDGNNLRLKEFFLDFSWQRRVYFRVGKQFLQWGRGYFWNPTDLINVEMKDLLDPEEKREGNYGLKVTVPCGLTRSACLYIRMEGVEDPAALPVAGKYTFLTGNTEMAVSGWFKQGFAPVYGFEVSTRLFRTDFRGELSLSCGENKPRLDYETLTPVKLDKEWVYAAAVGFTKTFDHKEVKERFSFTGEYYYNHTGYTRNIFTRIMEVPDPAQRLSLQTEYLSRYYQPYRNSRHYLAFLASMRRFIKTDLTFQANGVVNLVDGSAVLGVGVSYRPVFSGWWVDLSISGYTGEKNTEATFLGNSMSLQVNIGNRF